MRSVITMIALLVASSSALPGLLMRGTETVNPAAVTGTKCGPKTAIVDHDINVALLSICGGISGTIEQCGGSPTTTTGKSGTALLTLNAATKGQTIDITKGRWEGCMRAARATCGDSPFTSTCIGGADGNKGNVDFALSATTAAKSTCSA